MNIITQKFMNKTGEMQKRLTNFSRIIECGAVQKRAQIEKSTQFLDSFFSGALCVLSGGRLPEALFMVFLLDSKGAKVCGCPFRSHFSKSADVIFEK